MIQTKELVKVFRTDEVETTIIMVTHSPSDAEKAHRIVQLFDGHVVTENIKNILLTAYQWFATI